jgi:hypothetical protein
MAVVLAAVVTGLFGTVVRSPTTPVCVVGTPCSKPAAGVTLTFSRARYAPRSVLTAWDGAYRIALQPGIYTVRVARISRIERLTPATVTVRSGPPAKLAFTIDTGIR